MQLRGHGLAGALIFGVHFMAEGGSLDVKGHGQVLRLLLLQNLEHDIAEAVYGVGVETGRIGQLRNAVKGAV